MTVSGTPVPHESARGHVTGDALYTDDLIGRFPGLLHAWPVLAPHAHAHLLSVDVTPALSEPGVVQVLTAPDVPGDGNTGPSRHDEPLFPREVMFHGQPIAGVLAQTVDAARQGAERVRAEYEPLPAILTIEDAIAAGSFLTEPHRLARGDVSVIASSALRFEGELTLGGQEHFYLETQSAIAWIDETGAIAVHASTQHPAETQEVVARVLGLPRHQVSVECLRMGGAFGGKEVQANAWAAVAALGAWKTGRPVRVRLTRQLDMMLTGKRHPYLARYSAGFSAEGRIEALRLQLYSDGGWSLDLSEPVLARALCHIDNAYWIPNVRVDGRVAKTNKTSQEYAVADVISRGRLEIGFVKSGGSEMASGNANPIGIVDRFWEAIDLILKTLTHRDGPFSWEGKYFTHRHVNIWPPPWQRPHPRLWAATGDPATEPIVRGIPSTKFARQVPPRNSRSREVQHGLQEHSLRQHGRLPTLVSLGLLDARPHRCPKFVRDHQPHGIQASRVDRYSISDHKCLP